MPHLASAPRSAAARGSSKPSAHAARAAPSSCAPTQRRLSSTAVGVHFSSAPAGVASSRSMALLAASAALPTVTAKEQVQVEVDVKGRNRVKFETEGWNFWEWQGHRIHFMEAGPKDAPKVVLIHGYGASAYHWRYNIPALAEHYHVFAVDLLGFGWSTKALVDYSGARLWTKEISDFIKEVVGGGPVVLAGNSLGGYAAMSVAANHPDLVRGLALLNAAGPFDDPSKPTSLKVPKDPFWQPAVDAVVSAVKRVVLYFAFLRARQPERIKEVLTMVYASTDTIDEDLVNSIVQPALDPKASEVFFLVNQNRGPRVTVNRLLSQIKVPMLLLWGDLDPWITPSRAQMIMGLYPKAKKVGLQSGHCPHDDTPEEANEALLQWLDELNLDAPTPKL